MRLSVGRRGRQDCTGAQRSAAVAQKCAVVGAAANQGSAGGLALEGKEAVNRWADPDYSSVFKKTIAGQTRILSGVR